MVFPRGFSLSCGLKLFRLLNLFFCGDKWPHYRDEPILEAANKALWPSICQGGKDPMHDMNGALARGKNHRAFGWNG